MARFAHCRTLRSPPQLDLTVLLSVAVQFDIPRTVLVGCMEVLCDGELRRDQCRDLADLPPFVKTALVWKLLQGLKGADGEGMNNKAYSLYAGEELKVR